MIGEVFQTKGIKKNEKGDVGLVLHLYYDFTPGFTNPVLLFWFFFWFTIYSAKYINHFCDSDSKINQKYGS